MRGKRQSAVGEWASGSARAGLDECRDGGVIGSILFSFYYLYLYIILPSLLLLPSHPVSSFLLLLLLLLCVPDTLFILSIPRYIYIHTHSHIYASAVRVSRLFLPLRIFPPAHLLIFVSPAPRHHDETTTATINPSPPPPRPSVLVPSSLCVRARVRAWEQAAVVAPPPPLPGVAPLSIDRLPSPPQYHFLHYHHHFS